LGPGREGQQPTLVLQRGILQIQTLLRGRNANSIETFTPQISTPQI
jgi:hypothetical protein